MRKKLQVGDKIKVSKKTYEEGTLSRTKNTKAVVVSVLKGGVIGLIRKNYAYREYYHEKFWELDK